MMGSTERIMDAYTLWEGSDTGAATLAASRKVPQSKENRTAVWSINVRQGFSDIQVHCSIVHSSSEKEPARMCTNTWVGMKNQEHWYIITCKGMWDTQDMCRSGDQDAKWNKPVSGTTNVRFSITCRSYMCIVHPICLSMKERETEREKECLTFLWVKKRQRQRKRMPESACVQLFVCLCVSVLGQEKQMWPSSERGKQDTLQSRGGGIAYNAYYTTSERRNS